jgi:tetratricopeptide (TPR) repeat protein
MDEGLAHFREAVAIVPENVQYRANLASALVQAGRPTEAIAECQEALRLAPDFAKAHLRLGLALASLGRFEEALREYREALRLQPDLGEAYNNIGLVMTLKGRLAEAEVAYREALRYQPELTEVHDNLANTLVNLGRPDEALAHYGEALRGQPDAPNVLNDLAWVRATYPDARFRNASEALALSGRACELTHGERPDYLDVLAASLAEAGRFEDAIRVAEQARALAEATGRKDVVAVIEGRLKFYRANQPYRMPVPTAAKAASAEEAAMAGKPAATPGR